MFLNPVLGGAPTVHIFKHYQTHLQKQGWRTHFQNLKHPPRSKKRIYKKIKMAPIQCSETSGAFS